MVEYTLRHGVAYECFDGTGVATWSLHFVETSVNGGEVTNPLFSYTKGEAMLDTTLLAISDWAGENEKQIKTNLTQGVHDIDEVVTLHVKGIVTRFANGERTPTCSIPLKLTLALMLGKGREEDKARFESMLVEAMTEALAKEKTADTEFKEQIKHFDEVELRVKQLLGELPKVPCNGKTVVKAFVTEVAPITTLPEDTYEFPASTVHVH